MTDHVLFMRVIGEKIRDYGYNDISELGIYPYHSVYSFSRIYVKNLTEDRYVVVVFDWRSDNGLDDRVSRFTIRCLRIKTRDISRWYLPDYENVDSSISTTLGQIIWHEFHRREYPVSYVWWDLGAGSSFLQLASLLSRELVTEALPWMENLESKIIMKQAPMRNLFRKMLYTELSPILARYGYIITEDVGLNVYFTRPLWGNMHAFVLLACGVDHQGNWNFDVHLERNVGLEWTKTSVDEGYVSMPISSINRVVTDITDQRVLQNCWVFHDHNTLIRQIQHLSGVLVDSVFYWLHSPLSRHP